jgi:hypothetical protein
MSASGASVVIVKSTRLGNVQKPSKPFILLQPDPGCNRGLRIPLAGSFNVRSHDIRFGLEELSDGITRQHDQGEYSKDGAYGHVHAIEARRDQAECVLFSPVDAAARVGRHRRQSPAEEDDGASNQKKDQSEHPRWKRLPGIAGKAMRV